MSLWIGVGLSLAVFLFVLDSIIDRQVDHTLDEQLAARSSAVMEDLATRRNGSIALDHPMYGEPIYFEILDRAGQPIATSGFRGALRIRSGYPLGRPFNLTLPNGHPGRAMASPVPRFDSEGIGIRDPIVVVAEDRSKADELSGAVDAIIWTGFAVILVISSGFVLLTVRSSLRPLEALAVASTRIPVDESPQTLPLTGMPHEILPLGEQFNRLLGRLRSALDRERDFSENLAHELRTPLAEVRTLSETGTRSANPQELRASLEQAGEAALRMQSVTESLLAFARANQSSVSVAEPFDLAVTIRRYANERTRRLSAAPPIADRLPQELWVVADPRLAEMIVANLLANAFQHGVADAPVELDWLSIAGRSSLRIRNGARGLTPLDLADFGRRWWQRRSRGSDAHHPSGSGLGLSIARSLCEATGLELSFAVDAEQRFSVTLAGFTELGAASRESPT